MTGSHRRPSIHRRHPAETAAGAVGSVVGLGLAAAHVYGHWSLDAELQPYVPIVTGWIAGVVTFVVNRRRR